MTSIKKVQEKNGIMYFTIENCNVSIVNSLRRTILSDVETAVFRTFPYSKNKADIIKNTSKYNNEFLKQRLSCIPIHINDLSIPLNEYEVEIHVKNDSKNVKYVTTEDFIVKQSITKKPLSKEENKKIFPPDKISKNFILFAKLQPQISDDLKSEEIHIIAKIEKGASKENGSFNVASTCSYFMAPDKILQEEMWQKVEKDVGQESKKSWLNHDGKRYVQENSFNFILESLGVFTNKQIISKACNIIKEKLNKIADNINIMTNTTSLTNSFDITLENEGYTIGKIIEYMIHKKYYLENKQLSFIGFKKFHPHDKNSIIRIAYREQATKDECSEMFVTCCKELILLYSKIEDYFL